MTTSISRKSRGNPGSNGPPNGQVIFNYSHLYIRHCRVYLCDDLRVVNVKCLTKSVKKGSAAEVIMKNTLNYITIEDVSLLVVKIKNNLL